MHPSQKLLEDMIQLAKELEKEGVRAITTSCGFNAIFQEALANAVDIPVFTSSLLQVPFAQALVGRDRAVGVITASASSLSEKHLRACGITDEMHPIVMGLENAPEWSKIFDHPDDSFDMDLVTEEILNVARQGVKDHPEIGAIVLECTDLPPFARRIREELDIPVMHEIFEQSVHFIDPNNAEVDLEDLLRQPLSPSEPILKKYSWEKCARMLWGEILSLE